MKSLSDTDLSRGLGGQGLVWQIAVLIASVILVFAYLRWPLWPDHSTYLSMGANWLKGVLPYRDVFDQNWPGIIWLSQLIEYLVGGTPLGVRVFDLVWQIFSALILYSIARRHLQQGDAGLAVVLYITLYLAASHGSTAQREGFASLFLGIAMYLLAFPPERWEISAAGFAGVLMGLAVLLKPTLGTIPFVLTLHFLALYLRHRISRHLFFAMVMDIGFFVPFGILCFFFWQSGILSEFFDAGIIFAMKYSTLSLEWILKRTAFFFIAYPPGRLFLILLASSALVLRKNPKWFQENRMLALFALGSFLSLAWQKRFAYYHAMPFCYFGSVFAVAIFHEFKSNSRGSYPKFLTLWTSRFSAGFIVLCLTLPIGRDLPASIASMLSGESAAEYGAVTQIRRDRIPWDTIEDVGYFLRSKAPENVPLLCLAGSECPHYYYASGLKPFQRYIQPTHFVFDTDRLEKTSRMLRENQRPLLLVTHSSNLLPIMEELSAIAKEGKSSRVMYEKKVTDKQTVTVHYVTPLNVYSHANNAEGATP